LPGVLKDAACGLGRGRTNRNALNGIFRYLITLTGRHLMSLDGKYDVSHWRQGICWTIVQYHDVGRVGMGYMRKPSERVRRLLELLAEGRTYQEISDVLGVPEGTLRTRYCRWKKKISKAK